MRKIVLVFLLIVLGMVSSAFGWTTIQVSKTAGVNCTNPKVSFGPDGRLHMVWAAQRNTTTTEVVYVNFDGVNWTSPLRLNTSTVGTSHFPDIASNSKGSLAVIWEQNAEHWVRFFNGTTQAWEEPFRVGESDTGYFSQPKIALDNSDNIHAYWFSLAHGWSFVRSRINGVWENQYRVSQPFRRSKEGSIAVASDGTVWVIYIEKSPDGIYRIWWRRRTPTTFWSDPARFPAQDIEQQQPDIAIDPTTSIPWTVYNMAGVPEGHNAVGLFKMVGTAFTFEQITDYQALHYPRIAIDGMGHKSLAWQTGQGDHGTGVAYTNESETGWTPPFTFANSSGWPKLPGIAAEAYGNVAECWSSKTDSFYQAYVSTKEPVALKRFDPPTNRSIRITVAGIGGDLISNITFNFSWQANPANNDACVRGYRIYMKQGGGEFAPLFEANKSTFSWTVALSSLGLTGKPQFAVATVALNGYEGERVAF